MLRLRRVRRRACAPAHPGGVCGRRPRSRAGLAASRDRRPRRLPRTGAALCSPSRPAVIRPRYGRAWYDSLADLRARSSSIAVRELCGAPGFARRDRPRRPSQRRSEPFRALSRADLSPCTSRPGRSPIGLTSTRVALLAFRLEHAGHLERDPAAEADAAEGIRAVRLRRPELSDEHRDHDVHRHDLRPEVVVELERVEGVVALEASSESAEPHGAPVVRGHEVERRSRVARVDRHRPSARVLRARAALRTARRSGRRGWPRREVVVTAKLRDLGEELSDVERVAAESDEVVVDPDLLDGQCVAVDVRDGDRVGRSTRPAVEELGLSSCQSERFGPDGGLLREREPPEAETRSCLGAEPRVASAPVGRLKSSGLLGLIALACVALPAAVGATPLGTTAPVAAAANTTTYTDSHGREPGRAGHHDHHGVEQRRRDHHVQDQHPEPRALTPDMLIAMEIDSDNNAATGSPEGTDYAIELVQGEVFLYRWDGENFTRRAGDPPATSLIFAYQGGATLTISAARAREHEAAAVHWRSPSPGSPSIRSPGDLDFTNATADVAPGGQCRALRVRGQDSRRRG